MRVGGPGRSAPAAGRGRTGSPGRRRHWSGGALGSAGSTGGRRARISLHCAASRIVCGMPAGQLGNRANWRQTSRPNVTTHTVTPNERCSWTSATAPSLDDAKSIEKARMKIAATRNRVSQCRNRITGSKTCSSGFSSIRSIGIPQSDRPCRAARRADRIGRTFIPAAPHARAEFGVASAVAARGRRDTNPLPRQRRRGDSCAAGLRVRAEQQGARAM